MVKKQSITVSVAPPMNPRTADEWQNAVDAAKALLVLDSAELYGLVRGGPAVNVERCEELLDLGRAHGITPAGDAVERFVGGSYQTDTR